MVENKYAVAIISESLLISEANNWLISEDGLAAVHWNQDFTFCTLVEKGDDYVMIEALGMRIISYYSFLNIKSREFEASLSQLQNMLERHKNGCVVLAGDFNARSPIWGDRLSNIRGKILIDWIEYNDFRFLNNGTDPTYFSNMGESIIDLIWSSLEALGRITNWHVAMYLETLSVHRAFIFQLATKKKTLRFKN